MNLSWRARLKYSVVVIVGNTSWDKYTSGLLTTRKIPRHTENPYKVELAVDWRARLSRYLWPFRRTICSNVPPDVRKYCNSWTYLLIQAMSQRIAICERDESICLRIWEKLRSLRNFKAERHKNMNFSSFAQATKGTLY